MTIAEDDRNDTPDTVFEKLILAIQIFHDTCEAIRKDLDEPNRALVAAALALVYEAAMQLEDISLDELNKITGTEMPPEGLLQ